MINMAAKTQNDLDNEKLKNRHIIRKAFWSKYPGPEDQAL